MATDAKSSSRRGQRRPPSPGPLTIALVSAMVGSGLGKNTLAREAGVDGLAVRKMIDVKGDIALATAEKLFEARSLAIAPGPGADDGDTPRPLREGLLSAILGSGLTSNALGVMSGVAPMHVRRIIQGQGDVMLNTADKLAAALGLKVVTLAKPRPTDPEESPPVLSGAMRSAIAISGLSIRTLAAGADVDEDRLSRFYRGEGDVMLATASRVFPVLSLAAAGEAATAQITTSRDLAETLRAAILDSGLSLYALARRAGCIHYDVRRFADGRGDIMLGTGDKLAAALKFKVVRVAEPRPPATKPRRGDQLEHLAEALRRAIADASRGVHELARQSGVSSAVISRLVNRRRNPDYPTCFKLAGHLGLNLNLASVHPGPPDPMPAPAKHCPIELREGFPIRVYGVELPPMTGIAYDLTAFAVERYRDDDYCKGHELAGRTTSTTDNPIKSLKLKLKEPGFRLLARVLIWDGKRGGSLRIIDPGPEK